jgi:hypothetical protein
MLRMSRMVGNAHRTGFKGKGSRDGEFDPTTQARSASEGNGFPRLRFGLVYGAYQYPTYTHSLITSAGTAGPTYGGVLRV